MSFTYPGQEAPVLRGVSLSVERGERVILLGHNACGKSTLLGLANGSLLPSSGRVLVDGADTRASRVSHLVGLVRQDHKAGFATSTVEDEVAFGASNLALPKDEVAARTSWALERVGLGDLRLCRVGGLSRGQRLRLALACALALYPRYLVLDENDALFCGPGASEIHALMSELVASGTGVIEVTHSTDELVLADRVVTLAGGRLRWRGTPQELLESARGLDLAGFSDNSDARIIAPLARLGLDISGGAATEAGAILEFAQSTGRADLLQGELSQILPSRVMPAAHGAAQPLEMSYVTFDYASPEMLVARGAKPALDDVSFMTVPGTLTLLAGACGSGKSTAAQIMAGLLTPNAGKTALGDKRVAAGAVGISLEWPEDQLLCKTVAADVGLGPRNLGLSGGDVARRVDGALALLGIPHLADRPSFSLSGGERRRVALAGVVAQHPSAYVFDEPTASLDGDGRRALHQLVATLVNRRAPVVIATQDVEEWIAQADQVVLLRGGRVIFCGPASRCAARADVFGAAGMVAPRAVRIADLLLHGSGVPSQAPLPGVGDGHA